MLRFYCLLSIICLLQACIPDSSPDVDTMDETLSEEEAYFADYEASDMKFGYINTAGQLAIKDQYDGVREFSEGLAAVNHEGKWGYIDFYGRNVIPHLYRSAFAFKKGIARVQDFDKKYWFIDNKGKVLNQEGFIEAYDCINGMIRVITNNGYNYISLQGDTLLPAYCDGAKDFNNGLAVVKRFGKYGVINPAGQQILPFEYRKVYLDDQLLRVQNSNGFTIMTRDGNRITEKTFTSMSAFQNNKAVAKEDGQLFMINSEGAVEFSLPSTISRAEPAGSTVWRVYTEEGLHLMSESGTILTRTAHDQIFNFSEGLACYARGDKWGYLNEAGEEQIRAKYDLIWDFKSGRARVVTKGGIGFIDPEGELVIPPIFFEVKDFEEGLARVQIYRG